MYHVIIIGIISVILYILTLTGSKFEIIPTRTHRAFWNTILLIAFFGTAGAGIFLALQSNYKWNIEGVEKILNWHVDFGIALSFTALIHLTWHLNYYKGLLRGRVQEKDNNHEPTEDKRLPVGKLRIMLLLLGFITGAAQVVFLREILNLSGGYEIAAGAVFACWIILSALGAKMAGSGENPNSLILSAILPLGSIVSMLIYMILSKILVEEGVTPGIIYTLIITSLSLIPFCFLSGYLFVRLSYTLSKETSVLPGNSFAVETTGSMIAGILITLLTGNLLGNFQIFMAAVIVYYTIFLLVWKFRFYKLLTALALVCMVMLIIFNPDTHIRNILLGSVTVIKSSDSKYGNIAISEYEGEKSVFYNHRLIDYEQDTRQKEENIHYAMVQHARPENILIISGGIDKHVQEALKYRSVKTITYLERDPELIACTQDTTIEYTEAEILIENTDAFSYINKSSKKYDVIISLLSEPDNLVTNRFYTIEYFLDIRKILSDDGVFMLKAGSSSSYISEEESGFLSTIYNSLNDVFKYILPVKGESIFMLASDHKLDTSIPELISARGIDNIYVNRYYLDNEIIRFNSDQVLMVIDSSLQKNRLDKPRAVFYNQKHHLEKTGRQRLTILFVICLILFVPFITGSNNARTMYSSSLNLAGTEILALILIQSTAGNFYQLAGLLIAVVMGGLAIGSSSDLKIRDKFVNLSSVLLFMLALLFAVISQWVLELRNGSVQVFIVLVIVLIPAMITGFYYRRKTETVNNSRVISGIYFADLSGAALGFMVIAGILVPMYGIKLTFYILAFFNFASYITNQIVIGIRRLI